MAEIPNPWITDPDRFALNQPQFIADMLGDHPLLDVEDLPALIEARPEYMRAVEILPLLAVLAGR